MVLRDTSIPTPDAEKSLDQAVRRTGGGEGVEGPGKAGVTGKGDASPARVASIAGRNNPTSLPVASGAAAPATTIASSSPEAIASALRAIEECKERYSKVNDYTCTFYKRERIGGRLHNPHVMSMKARTAPSSIYFKFVSPNKGREAIYVTGQNRGRIVAHDVGLGKFFAGTMHLDPRGTMAMEENRHPITEAGIGSLIDTVHHRWKVELKPAESVVALHSNTKVGDHPCIMIESIHPDRHPDFLFHKVKLYISQEHGLPVRFEAYDWPKHHGIHPELIEEYTYMNLRLNVGLRDHDFDPASSQYSFGRF